MNDYEPPFLDERAPDERVDNMAHMIVELIGLASIEEISEAGRQLDEISRSGGRVVRLNCWTAERRGRS